MHKTNVEDLKCLLCSGKEVVLQAELDTSLLSKLYRQSLGIDVSRYFTGIDRVSIVKCRECDFRWFFPVITGNDNFYGQLREHSWYYINEKQEFLFASQEAGMSDDVLDVGCGEGNFAKYIKSKKYVGLEQSPSAVHEAKARGINVISQTVEDYAERHPHSADVVCAFQVLEHVANPKSFLAASIRCLRSGGRLIISVPSADSFLSLAVNNVLNCPPHHISLWSDEALRSVGRLYGLHTKSIYNDRLADEHLDGYLNTLVIRGLDSKRRGIHIVDDSFRLRVYYKIASMLIPLLRRGLFPTEMRPRGHSTTVVFTVG